ncbi:MAG: PASTA domain-containing protein [Acidobacteriota bacterium]
MKTYSRTFAVLLVLTALLPAVAVSAQERAPVTPIKRTPSVILDTQARAKVTPTPSPTPKFKIKLPREIPTGVLFPRKSEEPQQQAQAYPKMPNLMGQPFRSAESLVRRLQPNVQISVQEGRYTNNYRPGVVINQSPQEGVTLKPGAAVVLYYNPQQSRFPKMPNLIGINIAEAEMRLFRVAPRTQSQRILSRRHNPNYGDDAVVAQSPDAGTELSSDVRVVLYVNSPPVYPKMPNLVGMDIRSAQAKLSGDAPNYPQRSIEESEFNPRFKPGEVVNQIPRAGMALQPRGVAVMYYNPQQPKVIVPDVMGLTVPNAVSKIEQNNLVARLPRQGNFNSYIITGQSPQAGTVVEVRSPVVLTVSATVVVPDVRRSLLDDAQQTISRNRLTVGSVTTRISSVRQDEVLSQTPAPNSVVVEGTAVNLVIAKPQQVRVPDVLNQQQGNAEQALRIARLAVGQVTKRESPRTVGTVLDQNPRAGTMVNVGSQVSLVIAEPETVVVPDLRNGAQGNAEQLIANARLVVGQVTKRESPRAEGTVLDQNPSAGTRVNVGSQVSFVTAVPETVLVPELRNRTQGNAEQMIVNARLAVGQLTTQQATVAAGTVLSQMPAPGTRVTVGSSVNFVVALAVTDPPPSPPSSPPVSPLPTPEVVVPNLAEKELTEAFGLLRTIGLGVGEVKKKDEKETASFILEQQPAAGQRVKPGTLVNLVIGKKPDELLKEWPKALLVGAFGFAAFLLTRLWKRLRPNPPDPEPPPPAPALSFRSTMNAGSAEFAASTELQTNFALRFLPKADWGQQHITLTGGFIAAESEEL